MDKMILFRDDSRIWTKWLYLDKTVILGKNGSLSPSPPEVYLDKNSCI